MSAWSVFVNLSGEWKLGGLEYVSPVDGNSTPPVKLPSSLEIYDPPEKNDTAKLKLVTKWFALPQISFLMVRLIIIFHILFL